MSERGFVLDTTVVSEVARGDMPLITLLLELDQQGLRLTVPALVVAAVAAEMGGSDKTGFLPAVRGIARLDHGAYGPLGDFDDALELGQAAARLTGDGRPSWEDAHTVMLARLEGADILTLDAGRWAGLDLDGVQVTEISDPD
ncbi:hypothetical protein OHB01_03260 [Microbispora hainanensis]|uniref:Type II toxin-antitoxin system VapC family toxin n=1 Tax=Microbispora hainanensis TaxID=568844 RepID=A0ABZ1SNM7_9ACTN|nr:MULTISPECIES: hypothetical protein [Microbispora]NJP24058.1 hypothetical protein [Microbispora sp. CL1-1]TQS15563.1 hypothetical protein FLW53_07575 [Microbispora sp. SCL1-1]